MLKEGQKMKDFRQQLELASQLQKIREEFDDARTENPRVLKSARYVKQQLENHGAFQVKDDDGAIGIVVEPKLFESLLTYVELLENQLEKDSFEAMVENRKGDTGFMSGDALLNEALQLFDDNENEIRRFLDDDK